MILNVSSNVDASTTRAIEPKTGNPHPFVDMLKFDLAVPDGALLGNLVKYVAKPFQEQSGLAYHLEPIFMTNDRWHTLTVTIHKPKSSRDVVTFLDIAQTWKHFDYLGFCYAEMGLDTYVSNWRDVGEKNQKIALAENLAYFLDRKHDFGRLNGSRLHAYRQRSNFADDNFEGINIEHIVDLACRGYNFRVGNKNSSRAVNYQFDDLYFHFYVKTFEPQHDRYLDRGMWRSRKEIGIRGDELRKIITPEGFKLENQVGHFSVPKLKLNRRPDRDGMSWSKQGCASENSKARSAFKNQSRPFKVDRDEKNGSIFFVSNIPSARPTRFCK
jgi:hypothetical protein